VGPGEKSLSVLIIVGGKAEGHLESFEEVTEAPRHTSEYAMPYESNRPIYVCRGPKEPISDLWPRVNFF